MKNDNFGQLKVKLQSPFHVYYDGGAESVSAINETGPFDILPGHANFFTLLTEGTVKIISAGEEYTYNITRGVAQVADNTVEMFTDI